MKPVFTVYLKRAVPPDSSAHALLDLPAPPYAVLDALDKLRLEENGGIAWDIAEYPQFEELEPLLDGNGSFYELNALAQKLSELDDTQRTAFAGLLEMEASNGPIPMSRLIDLAHSTGCCQVLHDALNDSQLGRICAETGFDPRLGQLPKDVFDMLDFEQIGRNTRTSQKGVFVERSIDHPGGYVAKQADLTEAYKRLDLKPKEPDYEMLLEVFHDCGKVQLKLPAVEAELDAVPTALDEPDWWDLSWRCLDCRVPSLTDAVSDARDIDAVNRFAEALTGMDRKALIIYKALLEAFSCQDLLSAELLAEHLPAYAFSPQISYPAELAKEALSVNLRGAEAKALLPHVDLQHYGEALIKDRGGELTGYGLIERIDGQPLRAPLQPQSERGMTLE